MKKARHVVCLIEKPERDYSEIYPVGQTHNTYEAAKEHLDTVSRVNPAGQYTIYSQGPNDSSLADFNKRMRQYHKEYGCKLKLAID